jgi:hypothetical protein
VASGGRIRTDTSFRDRGRLRRFLRGCRFRHPGQTPEVAPDVPSILFHSFRGIAFRQKELVGKGRTRFDSLGTLPAGNVKKTSVIGSFDFLGPGSEL